ncbi:MAG: DUF3330 domain-containing protein [Gammaproteobacteria bacterium]|nr:DUF3330 domain-containing protein [Gammaproteobacteria bacterium]
MPDTPRPEDFPKVSCELCRKEVARSEAKSAEGRDYVLFFCGIDCYEQWCKDQEDGRAEPPSPG